MVAEVHGEEVRLKYRPHRCHSAQCPFCAYENFRKDWAVYSRYLEELGKNGRLSFVTLTLPSSHDPYEAIEMAYRSLSRLYQFRIFGPRNWKKVVRMFLREVLAYYRAAKRKGDPSAFERAKRQIRLFRKFIQKYSSYIGSDIKFGQLFNIIWKFEITYNPEHGYHPHWHGVGDIFIPKLLLVVIWRLVSSADVVDIRAVDDRENVTSELVKYITKHWELKDLSEEQKIDLETAMYGRRKFRVWGFGLIKDLEEEKEEKEEKRVHLWWLKVELSIPNLHNVPRLVRLARKRDGPIKLCRAYIYDERSGVWEGWLFVNADGDLELVPDDPSLYEVVYAYAIWGGAEF